MARYGGDEKCVRRMNTAWKTHTYIRREYYNGNQE